MNSCDSKDKSNLENARSETKKDTELAASNSSEDLNGQHHLVLVEEEDLPPLGKSAALVDPNTRGRLALYSTHPLSTPSG
uniref:Uncharacterized protein n=1 Tax=Oryza glumipatula TaxID=40148 RepID=A0A0D9Y8D2_9ORYZ